jgi:hypothetical protein
MMDETRNAYPLEWPVGWKRTDASRRTYGKFNKKETAWNTERTSSWLKTKNLSIIDGVQRILESLKLMGIERDEVVISTNVRVRLDGLPRSGEREPDDPGAAVYWRDYGAVATGHQTRCMAIDRYTTVADNLAAIAATLDAMRAIERHGGAEVLDRAFTGFAALPEKATEPWRDVLELDRNAPVTAEVVQTRFRVLAQKNHPDLGGDRDQFERVVAARDQALREVAG